MPATIHFDRRGKRTTATLYVGNLEFKASTNDLKEALDREFDESRVKDVVIPRQDGRSRSYASENFSSYNDYNGYNGKFLLLYCYQHGLILFVLYFVLF